MIEENEFIEVDVDTIEDQEIEKLENDISKPETEPEKSELELLREELETKVKKDPEAVLDEYIQIYTELQESKRRSDEYLDTAQRTQANLENYRKQVLKEQNYSNFQNKAKILEQFLMLYDDLARTYEMFDKHPDIDQAKTAIRMVYNNLKSTFESLDVKTIEPGTEQFDPRYHEAIHVIENSDVPNNQIIEVIGKGFIVQDIVLRPAKVVIAKNNSQKKKE